MYMVRTGGTIVYLVLLCKLEMSYTKAKFLQVLGLSNGFTQLWSKIHHKLTVIRKSCSTGDNDKKSKVFE